VEIVPGASSDLPGHSPALVSDRMKAFLAGPVEARQQNY
jgi:hypothetical protein